MKTLKFSLLLFVLIIAAGCGERAQMPGRAFEGTITQVIQVPGVADMLTKMSDSGRNSSSEGMALLGAASNVRLKMYVRGDKLAYEVTMLGGLLNMRSIIDRNARTLTVLLPNRTAMVRSFRALDTVRGRVDDSIKAHMGIFDSLSKMIPQPTGRKDEIQGLAVEEYTAKAGGMDVTMWLSSDERLKMFDVIRDAVLGRGHTGTGGLEEVFEMMKPVAGKMPVKFESKVDGKVFAKGDLKEIKEEKLDDAVFAIPEGYEIVNADSMIRRNRPTGVPDTGAPKKQKTYTAPEKY